MKNRNQNIRVLIVALLALALGIGTVGIAELEAAARLSKPKLSLKKRTKKGATIKLKGGSVTGYRIYMKTAKKKKWQLQAYVMRGMKGKIKGKLATFSLSSDKLTLTKLKSKQVYYIRVRSWKSSWRRPGRIKLSPYSKTLKIGKYKAQTPSPTDANVATGNAVQFPDETPTPSEQPMETPSAEPTGY